MRSVKRPSKPVQRYRSLVSPGIAVLAVVLFYTAFAPGKPQKGETERFEQDGLCLEIAGVHLVGGFMENFDPVRGTHAAYDTYHVYPGSSLTVLEASGVPGRWELRRKGDEPLVLAKDMGPVELTRDFCGAAVYDRDAGLTLLSIEVRDEDEDYWK